MLAANSFISACVSHSVLESDNDWFKMYFVLTSILTLGQSCISLQGDRFA